MTPSFDTLVFISDCVDLGELEEKYDPISYQVAHSRHQGWLIEMESCTGESDVTLIIVFSIFYGPKEVLPHSSITVYT